MHGTDGVEVGQECDCADAGTAAQQGNDDDALDHGQDRRRPSLLWGDWFGCVRFQSDHCDERCPDCGGDGDQVGDRVVPILREQIDRGGADEEDDLSDESHDA